MSMARAAGSPASSVRGAAQREVSLLETSASLVRAEVIWGDADATAESGVDPAALVAVADRLTGLGARFAMSSGQTILRLETSVRLFGRLTLPSVGAVARRVHLGDAAMMWAVTFAGAAPEAAPLAMVSQTQAIEGARPTATRPVAGSPGDDRDEAEGTRSEAIRAEPHGASGRRDQIVAAAADLIARKGFAGASIREIADAAGLHVPTLYQYVASKDELLELVYSRTMAALQTDLDAEVSGCVGAEQKLRATIAMIVGRVDRFRHRIGILNRELRSLSPLARTRVIEQYRALLQQIAGVVEAGVESGEFRPVEPAIVANLIDAACDAWALRQFAVKSFGVEAFGREVADMFIRGLSRPDDPSSGR